MKKCFKCKEEKELTEFYKHGAMQDGRLGKCKQCTKQDVARHRSENLSEIREYDRRRSLLPHRRERNREVTAAWRAANPERRAAQLALLAAVKKG